MLKMFQRDAPGGGSVAFWEDSWQGADVASADEFYDIDPLKRWFDRVVRPGTVVLEGGCGPARYVAGLASRGVGVVGMDFSIRTLQDVRRRHSSLTLVAADVAQLPLGAGTVEVYFSGGVVEHFEAGPHAAIAEARRVLCPGGTLLISVPYFSPLRRTLAPFRRADWQRAPVHTLSPKREGGSFFQYAYRPEEFERILAGLGFVVVRRQGYSILWGLYEFPGLGPALRGEADAWAARSSQPVPGPCGRRAEGDSRASGDTPSAGRSGGRGLLTLAKRLLVGEDDTIPVAGGVVRALRWLAANMMLYECRLIGGSGVGEQPAGPR